MGCVEARGLEHRGAGAIAPPNSGSARYIRLSLSGSDLPLELALVLPARLDPRSIVFPASACLAIESM